MTMKIPPPSTPLREKIQSVAQRSRNDRYFNALPLRVWSNSLLFSELHSISLK